MRLTTRTVSLSAAGGEFRIARGATTTFDEIIVELAGPGGHVGLGEAHPVAYFDGETVASARATLASAAELLGDDPFRIEEVTGRAAAGFPKAHAALCGLDLALHDLAGKVAGLPVWRMLGLSPETAPPTSFTIGLAEPEVMAERALAASERGFRVLKIKIGTDRDIERIEAIRAVTDLPIRVDANTGWSPAEAIERIRQLADLGVELVEQPIAPGDNAAMRTVRDASPLPIMADESCVTLADVPGLVGCVDAINIKLMKCGGLREALRMIHTAQAHGLKVMLGCQLETSISITAAAQLSPLVDYLDLDGHLLIADDPYEGVTLDDGRLGLPERPGLGVISR